MPKPTYNSESFKMMHKENRLDSTDPAEFNGHGNEFKELKNSSSNSRLGHNLIDSHQNLPSISSPDILKEEDHTNGHSNNSHNSHNARLPHPHSNKPKPKHSNSRKKLHIIQRNTEESEADYSGNKKILLRNNHSILDVNPHNNSNHINELSSKK